MSFLAPVRGSSVLDRIVITKGNLLQGSKGGVLKTQDLTLSKTPNPCCFGHYWIANPLFEGK